jgi:hypothetical protein
MDQAWMRGDARRGAKKIENENPRKKIEEEARRSKKLMTRADPSRFFQREPRQDLSNENMHAALCVLACVI